MGCVSASELDISNDLNDGIKESSIDKYPNGEACINFDVKNNDKYDNEGAIFVDVSAKEYNEIKDAVKDKKPLTKTFVGEGKIIKKVYKVKKNKGTVLINKKTLKALKKAIKLNKEYCVIYDEGKYASRSYKIINKLLDKYDSKFIKIKVKGTVYRYSLFQKMYGDSRDYKYLKFYKVTLYVTGYKYNLKKAKISCKLNVKNGKVSSVFYANNKLLNYKTFYSSRDLT